MVDRQLLIAALAPVICEMIKIKRKNRRNVKKTFLHFVNINYYHENYYRKTETYVKHQTASEKNIFTAVFN